MAHRILEHQSPKKEKKTGKYTSALYEHHKLTGHKIDYDGVKNPRSSGLGPKTQSQRDLAHRQEKANLKHPSQFANRI